MSRINFSFDGDAFDSNIGNDNLTITQAYAKSLESDELAYWQGDE